MYFPKIKKLEHKDADSPYDELISWFFDGEGFDLMDDLLDLEYKEKLNSVPPLNDLIRTHQPDVVEEDSYFLKEFLLWGLVVNKKLSKHRFSEGYQFKDLYGSFISKL